MITVYADGKIQTARVNQTAGDFVSGSQRADLVVRNGEKSLRFVEASYKLQEGDALIVTPRGVAG